MSMYFLDETDDWPEYQTVRDEIHRLETKRAAVLKAIIEARSALGSDIVRAGVESRVEELEGELRETEKKLDESLSMYR